MTKKSYYPKPEQNIDFANIEKEVLQFWQDNKIFEESVNNRDSKGEFVFYDGPPFANGLPHYGHLLTGYIKDIVARYQTMKGKKVERKFGWDTHGLPVEMETEKELTKSEGKSISGQIAIQEYGIDKFNDACKSSVMKYASNWKDYVNRQGRWVDFDNGYKTMDINYMESVLWAFKELHNKGLMYEDFRVVPYSWACQTPLSNFETKMDNAYRRKESKAVTVKFELDLTKSSNCNDHLEQLFSASGTQVCSDTLRSGSQKVVPYNSLQRDFDKSTPEVTSTNPSDRVFAVAWTTTAWTLPSNLALAVNNDIDYVAFKHGDETLILAQSALAKYKKEFGEEVEVIKKLKGSDLVGLSYKPLLPYLAENDKVKAASKAFTILHGDFVADGDGTGIVHLASGFGEDDQLLCKANAIPTICPVDEAGKFTNEMFDLEGLSIKGKQVFETNDDIIKHLKSTNNWLKTEQYLHDYPHCWRTDTPLIYKAVSSWYVKVTDIKERMIKANQQINWIPDHIKDGQFGKWLEGARDWSISRNRFWGCPVPVWRSDDPQYPRIDVYGSLDQIEKDFGVRPDNLHRPYIDELTRPNPDDPTGKSKMVRVSDVLDCWFESGSMPYAQCHYPFENKEWFENNFPADFITEYIAQTRGWFYTLVVLSVALFDKPPFKNVICHGTILDEKAQKLSKRLKNYTDPLEIFSTYSSDAMRFYMMSQPVMKGQELRIDKDGKAIRDTLRLSIKPLVNAYNFFCLYANSDGVKASRIKDASQFTNIMDRYILSKLKATVNNIDKAMDSYNTVVATEQFNQFFEALNNWYIRRNRQRFWKSEIDADKQQAYDTLYTVILTICEAAAPLLPFITEKIWKDLTQAE